VVLEDGEMLGVMSSRDAFEAAQQRGLDLVEISPNAQPPVCKIMDFGKFKYDQKKKSQGQKKQASTVLKEITLSPVTQEHDIQFKVRNAIRFLGDGHRVKFTVRFRGRQMAHPEIGRQQMAKIEAHLKEVAALEIPAKMEGRMLAATFAPLPSAAKKAKELKEQKAATQKATKEKEPAEKDSSKEGSKAV
jgi:translation initiation factor IF-3